MGLGVDAHVQRCWHGSHGGHPSRWESALVIESWSAHGKPYQPYQQGALVAQGLLGEQQRFYGMLSPSRGRLLNLKSL